MENDVDVYALQVVFTGLTDNCTSGCEDGIISIRGLDTMSTEQIWNAKLKKPNKNENN